MHVACIYSLDAVVSLYEQTHLSNRMYKNVLVLACAYTYFSKSVCVCADFFIWSDALLPRAKLHRTSYTSNTTKQRNTEQSCSERF